MVPVDLCCLVVDRPLWSRSEAAQGHIHFSAVFIPDRAQGCGAEQAGAGTGGCGTVATRTEMTVLPPEIGLPLADLSQGPSAPVNAEMRCAVGGAGAHFRCADNAHSRPAWITSQPPRPSLQSRWRPPPRARLPEIKHSAVVPHRGCADSGHHCPIPTTQQTPQPASA